MTHTDLKQRTDELRRQAWLRAQQQAQSFPAGQILVDRIRDIQAKQLDQTICLLEHKTIEQLRQQEAGI